MTSEWRSKTLGMTSRKTRNIKQGIIKSVQGTICQKHRTEGIELSNGDDVVWGASWPSEKMVSIEKP